MTWNKKNQQFARSCALRPSSIDLAQYLLRRADNFKPTEVLLDLREFNREIGKDRIRGEYDRKTIKEAIAQLDELTFGWFVVLKSYTWSIHKVMVRPLQFAAYNKSQSLGTAPKLNRGNPMFSDEHKQRLVKQQQQDISKIDSLFKRIGLEFNYSALVNIWRMAGKSIDEVKNAVKLLLFQHSTQKDKIENAHGWIVSCVRYGWQKGLNLYYQPDLPYFTNAQDLEHFVDVGGSTA